MPNISPQQLWKRQQIHSNDVDYNPWNKKRESILAFAQISPSCIFIVDVFKERYDFASDSFAAVFGYNIEDIRNIQQRGDLLEEKIHPADRQQMLAYQIEHGQFIYSLPPEERNDYQSIFQYRMLNAGGAYVNVISRQQVIETDRNGKAWLIIGVLALSPDQSILGEIKRSVLNRKTGEILSSLPIPAEKRLSKREMEILLLIRQGLLSKEIADKLHLSLYTVNNHRKNILKKLNVDNAMEAVNVLFGYK